MDLIFVQKAFREDGKPHNAFSHTDYVISN